MVLALVRVIATYSVYSYTVNEPVHLAAGLEWWSAGRYSYNVQHPPLARVVLAAGPYVAGARSVGDASVRREASAVLRSGVGYGDNLWLARFGVLPFFLLACSVVWWWGRRVGGEEAGAFAVAVFTLVPAVVGHAGLATTDMPLVATLLALCAAWLAWAERPCSLGRGTLLGVAGGAALATKFSAIPFFAVAALVSLFVLRPWRTATARELAQSLALAALVGIAVLWASYGYSVGSAAGVMAPFPEFFAGLGQLARHNEEGHITYLLGRPATSGQLAFFPVAFAVKTPIALWLLLLLGGLWAVQSWRRSGKRDYRVLLPLFIAGAIFGVAIAANINAGVRHILPVYALLSIVVGAFVARAWAFRGRPRTLSAVLLAALLIESTAAHPDALTYFNALVPNERGRVLVDSDLDWGQDLHRLRDTLQGRRITHLALAYYGSTDHARDVLPALRPLSQHRPDTGWLAISETYYRVGAISNPGGVWRIDTTAYKWLRDFAPVARVGKSIRLYRVPAAALQP